MARFLASLLLPSLLAFIVTGTHSSAQEPKKEAPAAFKQYLGVYTKSFPQQQIVLQHARVTKRGDRTFLVGTPVAVEENSTRLTANKDVVWWVALAEVAEFYEFDDLKGYRFDPKGARYTGR
jgi:hypothetical protein